MEPDRDEVLWRFAEEYRTDPTALRRWSLRYPKYVEDFVAEAAQSPDAGTQPSQDLSAFSLAARGVEVYPMADTMLATMRALHDGRGNRLDSIVERARSLGIEPSGLGALLDLGKTIVAKLERRLLDPATVPAHLVRRLGEVLHVSTESVRAYLHRPPTLAIAASYRADRAPRLQVSDSVGEYGPSMCADLLPRYQVAADRTAQPSEERYERPTRESFIAAVLAAPDMPDSQKHEWMHPAE